MIDVSTGMMYTTCNKCGKLKELGYMGGKKVELCDC